MPPAPPTFSTITCWPKSSERRGVRIRAMTSDVPPAAAATTMVTGRVGQSCAAAGAAVTTTAATAELIMILCMAPPIRVRARMLGHRSGLLITTDRGAAKGLAHSNDELVQHRYVRSG